MKGPLITRLRPATFVLTALIGTWLGHGIEYARTAGVNGLGRGLAGPLHGYMVPAGVVLMAAALLSAWQFDAALHRSRARINDVTRRLALAFRGRHVELPTTDPAGGGAALSSLGLWSALAVTQISLYVLQENMEAAAAGHATIGIGAIGGAHWAAPIVHGVVAAALAAITVAVRRLTQRQAMIVAKRCALLAALMQRLRADTRFLIPVDRLMAGSRSRRVGGTRAPPVRVPA